MNIKLLLLSFLVNNLINAQTISGGLWHCLTICTNNDVSGWGGNGFGQLGNSTPTDHTSPIQIPVLSGMHAVSAGGLHSLFLKNNGTAWASGANNRGQLGDGTINGKSSPFQIPSLTGIVSVSAGYEHSLFLKNDGTVWACGYNYWGQLGDGTTTERHTPIKIPGVSGIVAIWAGREHSLFVKSDGTVMACGRNSWGQVGIGSTAQIIVTPQQVSGITNITAVSGSEFHSLFLKNDGTVWGSGESGNGQLSMGNGMSTTTPIQIPGLTGIVAVAAGQEHSLFLKNDGTVLACGDDVRGALGVGSGIEEHAPVPVPGLTGIVAIAAGDFHSIFLRNDGTVLTCGYNSRSQLGDGTNGGGSCVCGSANCCKSIPTQVDSLCMVNMLTDVSSDADGFFVQAFPNPSSGNFVIRSTKKICSIEISNILGKRVYFSSDNALLTTHLINIQDQLKDFYFYKATFEDGKTATGKIIIE